MLLKPAKYRCLVFDAETNGLLPKVSVVHCIIVRNADTGQVWKFRRNHKEDTIEDALDLLDEADIIVGHNNVAYDVPMLEHIYGWVPKARIRDTMVLARLLFPDQKEKDYRLYEQGKLDGGLIGKHKLDAWGQRLGLFKGDYAKIKGEEAKALGYLEGSDEYLHHVWGRWTPELEEYCENDVAVTTLLLQMLEARPTSDDAVYVQHRLGDLMARQERNGFLFNKAAGAELADDLVIERERLCGRLDVEFPGRIIPKKRMEKAPIGHDVNGGMFPDFGITEDDVDTVRLWGYPQTRGKASPKYADPLRARWVEGASFTPIQWQEFNPRSRPQITDRLQELGWEPEEEDYTEKGNVKANDVILRRIIEKFPVAEILADLMALNKLMGQLADGKQAWLKVCDEDGFIHGYVNCCGAVTTRATHSYPNMAQVPSVKAKKAKVSDLRPGDPDYKGIVLPNAMWRGLPVLAFYKDEDGIKRPVFVQGRLQCAPSREIDVQLLGLRGGWGVESRTLFTVPDGFVLVGCDLAGIELRCLAHRMAAYDGGAYGRVLVEGDIHSENQKLAELDSRSVAKTFIYAFLYGAGDEKIGKIVDPLAPTHVQARLGKELKARFLRNLPALSRVIRDTGNQARRKFLEGLDGRRLFVRSKHAALNTDLQGMGATIANWWILNIEDELIERGYKYGWDGDYVFCAWVHDEVQIACREGLETEFKQICEDAAAKAGEDLMFKLKVDASSVHGKTWFDTH